METPGDHDGVLLIEVFKSYEEMYCTIKGRKFQAFRKAKAGLPASAENKGDIAVQVMRMGLLEWILPPLFCLLPPAFLRTLCSADEIGIAVRYPRQRVRVQGPEVQRRRLGEDPQSIQAARGAFFL